MANRDSAFQTSAALSRSESGDTLISVMLVSDSDSAIVCHSYRNVHHHRIIRRVAQFSHNSTACASFMFFTGAPPKMKVDIKSCLDPKFGDK